MTRDIEKLAAAEAELSCFLVATNKMPWQHQAGNLQLSKDGKKVYISVERSNLATLAVSLLTKFASWFGKDLRPTYGVEPNKERERAATTLFKSCMAHVDEYESIKETHKNDNLTSLVCVSAAYVQNKFVANTEFIHACNLELAERIHLPKASEPSGKTAEILKQADINTSDLPANREEFFELYETLLIRATKSFALVTTEKKLQARLIGLLSDNQKIIQKIVDPKSDLHNQKGNYWDKIRVHTKILVAAINKEDYTALTNAMIDISKARAEFVKRTNIRGLDGRKADELLLSLGIDKACMSMLAEDPTKNSESLVKMLNTLVDQKTPHGKSLRAVISTFKGLSESYDEFHHFPAILATEKLDGSGKVPSELARNLSPSYLIDLKDAVIAHIPNCIPADSVGASTLEKMLKPGRIPQIFEIGGELRKSVSDIIHTKFVES